MHGDKRIFPIGLRSEINVEKSTNGLATPNLNAESGSYPHSEPIREGFRHISYPRWEKRVFFALSGKELLIAVKNANVNLKNLKPLTLVFITKAYPYIPLSAHSKLVQRYL